MALDLKGMVEGRRSEQYELYARYINAQKVRAAKLMGLDRQFVRGIGCYLFDSDGNRYLDCDAGNGVFSVGRNNPRVRQVIATLLEEEPANWVARDTPLLASLLAESLIGRMPDGFGKVLFTNAGAETVEASIKFARKATGKSRVLYLRGDFHGLTYGALSVTDSGSRLPLMEQGFSPLLPGCTALPWGDIASLQQELSNGDVAALIVEPIQGASVRSLNAAYMREAQAICRRHEVLLVADEIMSGLGRTGTFLACQHSGVVPDLVLLAKALSGGVMPVGAMLIRTVIHDQFMCHSDTFVHASTFGENDYSMAAALATLAVIDSEGLIARAERLGALLLEELRALQARHSMIVEVVGRGLLVGVELRAPGGWLRQPAAMYLERRGMLGHLCVAVLAKKHRVLASAPTRNNVVRLHPPLIIDEGQVATLIAALDSVLSEAESFPDGVGRMAFGQFVSSFG
jgi:ornithine--oxo-acid transaminase